MNHRLRSLCMLTVAGSLHACDVGSKTSRSTTTERTTPSSSVQFGPTPPSSVAASTPGSAAPLIPPPPADLARAPGDTVVLRPGMRWRRDRVGTSPERADPSDTIVYHRVTYSPEGQLVFDSFGSGQPIVAELKSLPGSLTAVLLEMAPAERATLWTEAGADGQGTPPAVHVIDLVDIRPGRRAPRLPPEALVPPPGAKVQPNGGKCVVTLAGTSSTVAKPRSVVRTTFDCFDAATGRFFDGSFKANGPSEGPLSEQPAALRSVWAGSKSGAHSRCWFPAGVDLGLGEGNTPALVCDVVLLSVKGR